MVFHCRCFSFDEEEHIEYEIESQTQTKSTSTQTYYTASSAFSNMAGKRNDLRIFTHAELKTATNNFCSESKIGEGRHGSVYKGLVKSLGHHNPFDKIEVVVKYAKGVKKEHKDWLAEVNFLGVIEHPDLVKLVGYCVENHERGIQLLLVYEYMPNKSVKDHLSIGSEAPLSWTMRLKVARDAARGLSYLHEGVDFQILFRDFNSSRLLLDDQWNAKLSDLMVARIVSQEGDTDEFVGSVAYAAPEYISTGQVSTKSDVWSYGVFLYELITGRHPLDRNRPLKEQNLLEWVRPYVHSQNLQPIIDPRLKGMCSLKSAEALTIIAELCLKRDRKSRPKMSEVLERVNGVIWVLSQITTYVPVYESSMPVISRPKPLKFWFRKVCCCACIESGK